MKILKSIFVSVSLAGLTLSGWSQDPEATSQPVRRVPDAQASTTPTFTVLYNFGTKSGDPENLLNPGVLAQGRDGSIYSTSFAGGANNNSLGAVFKITPTGTLTLLYSFNGTVGIGAQPTSGLTLGTDGNLYGAVLFGGSGGNGNDGSLFKITPSGDLTVLFDFDGSDGASPPAPPIQAEDGSFYGITQNSIEDNLGTVYALTSGGELTSLFTFNGTTQGASPFAPLVEAPPTSVNATDPDGYFYGTTEEGGASGDGVVFSISRFGTHNVLHNFDNADGRNPLGALIWGSDGNLYGTTQSGGLGSTPGNGVIFKITPSGTFTVLHYFGAEANDGIQPFSGLVLATDGNFYGTTTAGGANGDGTIYELTPQGAYSILHNFDGTDGSSPEIALLQHTNGILYGATAGGGAATYGTFFSLNVGASAFVRLVSASGHVGATIEILGQGFTNASKVSFGGVAATVNVQSGTYLEATVPSGALFGTVTVTTSGGTLSSSQQFRVVPEITSFEPTSGPPGTEVVIKGSGFTQTTNVTFHYLEAASFTVNSDSQITAKVASGATTGPISVTRKGPITDQSSEVFTVTN